MRASSSGIDDVSDLRMAQIMTLIAGGGEVRDRPAAQFLRVKLNAAIEPDRGCRSHSRGCEVGTTSHFLASVSAGFDSGRAVRSGSGSPNR
jgi:hypothetical protein